MIHTGSEVSKRFIVKNIPTTLQQNLCKDFKLAETLTDDYAELAESDALRPTALGTGDC